MNLTRSLYQPGFLVLAIFIVAHVAGCSNSSGTAKKATGGKPNPMAQVSIDDVLAQEDYPEAAREQFRKWKEIGRKKVLQKEVDETIRLSMVKKAKPASIETASRFSSGKWRQPTLSVLESPLPEKYPRKPINALQLFEGKANYLRIGVEHFKKQDIYQLSDKDRQEVVDYMNEVLDGPDAEFNRKVWEATGVKGARIAKRLARQLKTEPMFNLCQAINEVKAGRPTTANKLVSEAIENFTINDYPTRLPIYAIRLRGRLGTGRQPRDRYPLRVSAMKYWITKDFRARGIDERYALKDVQEYYDLALYNRDLSALQEFAYNIERSRTLPKWFKAMALAKYHFSLGYYYRGNGFANTVTDEGWKELKENAKIAHEYYEEALEINPNFPEAATGLMQISRLGYSDKEEEFWFEKAIEHEVDYMAAYHARLRSLMPRWGGSVDKMLEFAKKYANKEQYETSVPFILPHCIFTLRDSDVVNRSKYQELTEAPELLEDLIKALQGLEEQNARYVFRGAIREKRFLQTLLALYLTRAGRTAEAERVYRKLEGQHSPFALRLYGHGAAGSLSALSATASAFSAEYGEEAKRLEKLMAGTLEERLKNFDAIEELVGSVALSDESGGLYFGRALSRVRSEKAFADGEVVNIDFDKKMNMWVMSDNRQLQYVSASSAMFDNREGNKYNQMIYNAAFPGPRTTEFTLKFPKHQTPDPSFAPGLIVGIAGDRNYSIGISITEKMAHAIGGNIGRNPVRTAQFVFGSNRPMQYLFPYKNNQCKIRMYLDKNWIEVYADNQFVFSYRCPQLQMVTPAIALQMFTALQGTGQVEISDLKIQSWSGAPPDTRISANLVKFYQSKFDADPDDMWNQYWLAHALHNDGDLDAALKLYRQSIESGVNKQMAGFYIGDILDRQGKRKEAFEWYIESATGKSEGGLSTLRYAHNSLASMSQELNWSCFRAYWLHRTCGFQIDEEFRLHVTNRIKLPYHINWLDRCRMSFVEKGGSQHVLDIRIKNLEKDIERTPEKYQYIPNRIKDALTSDGFFEVSPDDEPLYLKVEEATPFFRSMDRAR